MGKKKVKGRMENMWKKWNSWRDKDIVASRRRHGEEDKGEEEKCKMERRKEKSKVHERKGRIKREVKKGRGYRRRAEYF